MKVFIEDVIVEGEVKGKLYLESDAMQFIIREYNGKFSDKGVEGSKNHGYFTNIKSALTHLIKMKVMQSTAQTLSALREDIQRIESGINLGFDWNAAMPLERAENEEVEANVQ